MKSKRLHYLLKAIKHLNDEEYMDFFLERETNPLLLEFERKGTEVSDLKILWITENGNGWGFFAEFRAMLAKMVFAERFGLIPHVYWGEKFLYSEKQPVNGTDNAFEYYFRQPLDIAENEISKGCYVSKAKSGQAVMIEREFKKGTYVISDEYRKILAEIYRKYVKLNPMVKNQMETEICGLLRGKKTLGVHYRGTDYKVGYDIHPVGVRMEQAIAAVKSAEKEWAFEQIFLATDDIEATERFKKEFGDKVLFYQDVFRGDSNISVAFSQSERKDHHYRLGYEVIRDMYTLARCEGLVAGLSQVVICAGIVKESRQEVFQPQIIIDNGINHSNIKFKS